LFRASDYGGSVSLLHVLGN